MAALDALVTDWHGQGPVDLPGPVSGRRDCGRLLLAATSAYDDEGGGAEVPGSLEE